jgi:Cu+-exporting ATPase
VKSDVPFGKQAVAEKPELTTTKFKVDGMDCADCSKAIESKLIGISGVSTVSVDDKSGRAVVQYDPARLSKSDIIAAIDSLKFRASVIE